MSQTTKLIVSVVLYITILFPTTIFAQYNGGITAGFGIDGDALSGQSLNMNATSSQGSFDWFLKAGTGSNIGSGVIDTADTAPFKAAIAIGTNIVFSKGMSTARYSTTEGYLLMDARYGRDYFGFGGSGASSDLTTFTLGAKNGDDPTTWNTAPGGSAVSAKADIIDTYIHLRRNGTTVNNTNPSALILSMAASTVSSVGDRNIDFEWFRQQVTYNSGTGAFSNSGASATGGHTPWVFNADGSVKELGDITVSYVYGTGGVNDVSIYLWVKQTDYSSTTPARFNFVANEFYGNIYGYAKITTKPGTPVSVWAAVSTENTYATPWGTNSKELGTANTNYTSTQYAQFNFSEVALDLTAFGIDPALANGGNANSAPYKRMLVKTRSSSSFTSALQDFAGPYEFFDAPEQSVVVLPLKFLSFTATGDEAKVALKWNTTNEVNTSHFEVERSFDASNFKNIGIVLDGFQINATDKSYKFNDNAEELKGKRIAYYRLKQIDNDGKFTYSNVAAVRFDAQQGTVVVKVFPNPFVESLQMQFTAANAGKAQILIINFAGQTVATRQALVGKGSNAISVYELSGLKTGIYVAQLAVDGKVIASEKINKN